MFLLWNFYFQSELLSSTPDSHIQQPPEHLLLDRDVWILNSTYPQNELSIPTMTHPLSPQKPPCSSHRSSLPVTASVCKAPPWAAHGWLLYVLPQMSPTQWGSPPNSLRMQSLLQLSIPIPALFLPSTNRRLTFYTFNLSASLSFSPAAGVREPILLPQTHLSGLCVSCTQQEATFPSLLCSEVWEYVHIRRQCGIRGGAEVMCAASGSSPI